MQSNQFPFFLFPLCSFHPLLGFCLCSFNPHTCLYFLNSNPFFPAWFTLFYIGLRRPRLWWKKGAPSHLRPTPVPTPVRGKLPPLWNPLLVIFGHISFCRLHFFGLACISFRRFFLVYSPPHETSWFTTSLIAFYVYFCVSPPIFLHLFCSLGEACPNFLFKRDKTFVSLHHLKFQPQSSPSTSGSELRFMWFSFFFFFDRLFRNPFTKLPFGTFQAFLPYCEFIPVAIPPFPSFAVLVGNSCPGFVKNFLPGPRYIVPPASPSSVVHRPAALERNCPLFLRQVTFYSWSTSLFLNPPVAL